MNLYKGKLISLAIIFVQSVIGGFIPVIFKLRKMNWIIPWLRAFSGGIFLATGLIHLLMDAVEATYRVHAQEDWSGEYPLGMLFAGIGYMLVMLFEKVFTHHHGMIVAQDEENSGSCYCKDVSFAWNFRKLQAPLVSLLALSVHSILAGIAVGIASSHDELIDIVIAIVSHKMIASLALGYKFVQAGASIWEVSTNIILFACATPIGIGIGMATEKDDAWVLCVLHGLTAGIFLYVGTVEVGADSFETLEKPCTNEYGDQLRGDGLSHKHITHGVPPFWVRFGRWCMICIGMAAIALAQLAHPSHDDTGNDAHAGHGHAY